MENHICTERWRWETPQNDPCVALGMKGNRILNSSFCLSGSSNKLLQVNTAEREAAGIRNSTSKSESMVHSLEKRLNFLSGLGLRYCLWWRTNVDTYWSVFRRDFRRKTHHQDGIYWWTYIPVFNCGPSLWVMAEKKIRLQTWNKVSSIQKGLRVELLLLCIMRSHLRWLRYLVRIPSGGLPVLGMSKQKDAPRPAEPRTHTTGLVML